MRIPRRIPFIADALSTGNLAAGVTGIVAAAHGRVDLSVWLLLMGAALDGLDGAAARRFGSSPIGVLADDVADGVTNGLLPGAALGLVIGGVQGWVLGALYSAFTIVRLVYFTLDKGRGDPATFRGMPSTLGALIVLAALAVFPMQPLLVGALVGLGMVQMVAFDARYPHFGRMLAANTEILGAVPRTLVLIVGAGLLVGPTMAIGGLLIGGVAFALAPMFGGMREVVAWRRAS